MCPVKKIYMWFELQRRLINGDVPNIYRYSLQVSRSIGDAYLKKSEFNQAPLLARFRLPEPFPKPILSAEPSISVHRLSSKDQFVIFASDGLWDHLSNEEAVDIVHTHPRNVSFSISNYSQTSL